MLKQRMWAIEIRPYGFYGANMIIFGADAKLWGVTTGYTEAKGNKEGKMILEPSSGFWTEWSRGYSFQELREKSKEAISKFGQDNVRIVEIHNIEMITLPNA